MGKPTKQIEGMLIKMCGHEFTVYPPRIKDPYARMMITVEGLSPITGPTAPNLDAYMAMLAARRKAGLLADEVYTRLLEEIQTKQRERMTSDDNGDATGEIVVEAVSASVHVFVRNSADHLGLQSYSFRAALRECFSETGYFKKNRGTRERFSLGLGVWPLFITLERDGKPLSAPDGIGSHPVQVWAGGRKVSSITQFEYVDPPWSAKIMLEARHDSLLKLEDAASVLSMLPTVGWGAQRSMGYGRCKVSGVSDIIGVKDNRPLVMHAPQED